MAHAERAHALLSASGAKRWMSCPPSARLEEQFPDRSSKEAQEGTLAHELSELMLRQTLGIVKANVYKKKLAEYKKHDLYAEDMIDYCQRYIDLVIEKYNAALATTPDAQIIIEERLNFSKWVPEGFGTGDVLIIANDYIEVIDLKYGKGVKVDATDNPQMRLYGLGAYDAHGMLYDFQKVHTTIVQPRLDHIDTEELSTDALLSWGDEYVKPRAELADKGEGDFDPGDHCKFCRAQATCRARADANIEMAKYEFRDGPLLTIEEIGDILAKAEQLQSWAKSIQDWALDQAENHGAKFLGWKLVEGRSNRKITDEAAAASALELEGYKEDQIFNKKIKGITDLEKMLGKKKFEEYIGSYIVKPQGKPALVPESDKRPELCSADAAAKDFE